MRATAGQSSEAVNCDGRRVGSRPYTTPFLVMDMFITVKVQSPAVESRFLTELVWILPLLLLLLVLVAMMFVGQPLRGDFVVVHLPVTLTPPTE